MKRFILGIVLIAFIHICYAESPAEAIETIKERIKPVGQVSIVDNGEATDDAKEKAGVTPGLLPPSTQAKAALSGEKVYNQHCAVCHAAGIAGAPKKGVEAAWKERSKKGVKAMLVNAIKGLNAMPPKGTCVECSNKDLEAAIRYMCPECKKRMISTLLSIRAFNLYCTLIACGMLAVSAHFQWVMGLEPCPLCLVQRYVVLLIAIVWYKK